MPANLPLNAILSFCSEIKNGHGEDSFCYSFCDSTGMLAVFDGCGGAGSRKHACFSNHTEAYVASRLCAGAIYDYFADNYPNDMTADEISAQRIQEVMQQVLKAHEPKDSNYSVRGSMVRSLPSTAAGAIIQSSATGAVDVSALWAGDSRVYVLDSNGLAQISIDDTTNPDPMDALYHSGVLQNVFCSDRHVKLNKRTVRIALPCIVFAATDGCFDYVSTPMEFEGMLLQSMMDSSSIEQWEENLKRMIGAVSGDDHTLCLAAFGYMSFAQLKHSFLERLNFLCRNYLVPVSKLSIDDIENRKILWDKYKTGYLRYLKGVDNDGRV